MAKYGNVPILLRTVFFRLHGKHVKCMLILYILHKEKRKGLYNRQMVLFKFAPEMCVG